jgi:hypothetical protein
MEYGSMGGVDEMGEGFRRVLSTSNATHREGTGTHKELSSQGSVRIEEILSIYQVPKIHLSIYQASNTVDDSKQKERVIRKRNIYAN